MVLALMGIGLVFVYSSSFIFAIEEKSDGLFFFKKQLLFSGLGLGVLLVSSILNFQFLKKCGFLLWVLFGALTLATLIPGIGVKSGGASRWIYIFSGFYIEPSEFLKISLPFLLATLFTRFEKKVSYGVWALVILAFLPLPALLFQPDFGSFAVILSVALISLFIFGLRWRWISLVAGGVVASFFILVVREPYRMKRMMAFLDPWAEITGGGYQMIQSLLSFYSGGVLGAGLGEGQGKLFFLPEAHTDFILSVIGEETGFIGITILLLLYGALILRSLQLVSRIRDTYAQVVLVGLTSVFSIQVLTNFAVVLGVLPTKGLALPFLSYGGSSLIATCFLFGIILNLQRTFSPVRS